MGRHDLAKGGLAAAIARILRTPELRESIVRAGRTRIEREFAVASVVHRLRALFEFVDEDTLAAPTNVG